MKPTTPDQRAAVALIAGLVVLAAYLWSAIRFDESCGPGRVGAVGLFGPVCVCSGGPR